MMNARVDKKVIEKGLSQMHSQMLLPLDFLKARDNAKEFSREIEDAMLQITEQEQDSQIALPLSQVEYLKLRPFYYAACIGFKAFVFYNDGVEWRAYAIKQKNQYLNCNSKCNIYFSRKE